MKKLFNIKNTIASLSSNRINKKPIFGLIFAVILITIPIVFGFQGDFIRIITITLEPLQELQESEKTQVYFNIIKDIIIMLFVFLAILIILTILLNWIIKKVLSLFKKEITLYKLINISIYTYCVTTFLLAVLIILMALWIAMPIIKDIPISETTAYTIYMIPILINIFEVGLYIYGIKISIRNKNKFINNSPAEN